MRKIFVSLLLCLCATAASAQITLKPEECFPAQDSHVAIIDTFRLAVNIPEDSLTAKGLSAEDVGVVTSLHLASLSEKQLRLYRVTDSGTELIGPVSKKGISRTNAAFEVGVNYGKAVATSTVVLTPGEKYRLQIPPKSLYIATKKKGYTTMCLADTAYVDFYGPEPSTEELQLKSVTPMGGNCAMIDTLALTFNVNAAVAAGTKIQLYCDTTLEKEAELMVDPDDNTRIIALFDKTPLYYNKKYSLTIPANTIYMEGNTAKTYANEIKMNYTGANYHYFDVKIQSPASGSKVLTIGTVTATVDFPHGIGFAYNEKFSPAELYQIDSISGDSTLVGTYSVAMGSYTGTKTITSNISAELEPGVTYSVVIPENAVLPYTDDSHKDLTYRSTKAVARYTVASLSELPPIEIHETGTYENPIQMAGFDYGFPRLDAKYTYDGVSYQLQKNKQQAEVLFAFGESQSETTRLEKVLLLQTTDKLWVLSDANARKTGRKAYKGRKYKVTVPAGFAALSISTLSSVTNKKTDLYFEGTTETAIKNWSISKNDRPDSLGIISFTVNSGDVMTLKKDARMILFCGTDTVATAPIKMFTGFYGYTSDSDDESFGKATFDGVKLTPNTDYTLVIPDSVVDGLPRTELSFKSGETTAAAEYAKLNYVVKADVTTEKGENLTEVTTTTHDVEIGKDFTFSVDVPDSIWTVSVTADSGTLAENDTVSRSYTLSNITGETTITAVYTYQGTVISTDEQASGVAEIAGTDIKVSTAGGKIKITGLSNGDDITLYSINGMKMGSWSATEDTKYITTKAGTYLVVVVHEGQRTGVKVAVK